MKTFISLLFILLLNGCATNAYYYSVKKVNNTVRADSVIVNDILKLLLKHYPPAKTTFYIDTEYSIANNQFSSSFQKSFRSVGYAITNNAKINAIPLAWKIDHIGQLVRVTYHIENSVISRIYMRTSKSYKAYNAFTVEGLGKTNGK
ncbi:MAG: hypothetical protein Q9M36_06780 [Sulfurovum sp.]|nr:hypothetical protein [Sulfurovum sp.]